MVAKKYFYALYRTIKSCSAYLYMVEYFYIFARARIYRRKIFLFLAGEWEEI
jgi:hypothetical protein